METRFIKGLVTVALLFQTLQSDAKIVEIMNMSQILQSITRDTLVVFDLDNTIMEPTQTLGSDQWGTNQIARFVAKGLSEYDAKNQGVGQFAQVQLKTNVQVVETITPKLIQHLQKNNVQVIGLTARPLNLTMRSAQQLQSLGVNLATTAPALTQIFSTRHPSAYFQGILVVGPHNNKGEVLMGFMNASQVKASRIIFVDDKLSNVKNVNDALEKQNRPHVEFRYGAADAKVAAFNTNIGDMQWNIFLQTGRIISDQQALEMLNSRRRTR